MPVTPTRNLPPDSEPWGRWVDGEIQTIERSATKNQQDISNTLSAQAGTLKRLGEQVADLSALVASQTVITNTLVAQQAQLTAQVASINAIAANQVTAVSANASAGIPGVSTPTSATDYAVVTIGVPSGFTQANVMGVISGTLITAASPVGIQTWCRIAGVDGTLGTVFPSANSADSFANSHARLLTGLTAGSTFTITCRILAGSTAASLGGISTSVSVIFLK